MTPHEANLIKTIDEAFEGVNLEDGISLNMTEYFDSGGSMPDFAEKAKTDERVDWRGIPDATLEQFHCTFSFTDLKGFRFYIPAYMQWAIRNHRTSDSIIGDFTVYAIDPNHYIFEEVALLDWFTEKQLAAMVRFLDFAIQNDDTLDGVVAKENLDRIHDALRKQERGDGK